MNDEWNTIFERTVEGDVPQLIHHERVTAASEEDALKKATDIKIAKGIDCDTVRVHPIDDTRGFILSESKLSGGGKLS